MVVAAAKLADVGVAEGGGGHFLDGCVLGIRVSRGAEVAEMDHDGGKCHWALEERQMACPCAGKPADFAGDAASWRGSEVSGIRVDHRQPHRRHRRHLRLSSP